MADDVLNPPATAATPAGEPVALSQALLDATRAMGSAVTEDALALAAALRGVDPFALDGDAARVAFWANLYNALMRHAVVAWDLRAGDRVPLTTYTRAAYQVGAHRWSLHVIEHGVLRANRPAPFTFWRPISGGDPRVRALPRAFDRRVHFALNCAAASCPPVRSYDAEGLDARLDAATRAYVTQETAVDRERAVVRLPYLLDLYSSDFGRPREALAWAAPYLDEPDRAWLREHAPRAKVAFNRYDWRIVR